VVGGGSPRAVQQFHAPEFVKRDAAPVLRRSKGLQTAFAFSAVLVTKHPVLRFFVPSQPVRTKQTVAIAINSRDWPAGLHGRAHNPVNILPMPSSARCRNAHHSFRLLHKRVTLASSTFYHTVILWLCAKIRKEGQLAATSAFCLPGSSGLRFRQASRRGDLHVGLLYCPFSEGRMLGSTGKDAGMGGCEAIDSMMLACVSGSLGLRCQHLTCPG
jgi:hypothetical protein